MLRSYRGTTCLCSLGNELLSVNGFFASQYWKDVLNFSVLPTIYLSTTSLRSNHMFVLVRARALAGECEEAEEGGTCGCCFPWMLCWPVGGEWKQVSPESTVSSTPNFQDLYSVVCGLITWVGLLPYWVLTESDSQMQRCTMAFLIPQSMMSERGGS